MDAQSRYWMTPQPRRQVWKAWLLIAGVLSSCAKQGQIKIQMPDLPKQESKRELRSSCEIELDRIKDDMIRLRDELFDLKYQNQCWEPEYE